MAMLIAVARFTSLAARTINRSSTMQRILAADVGGFTKTYEYSNYALGVATPLAAFSSKDGFAQKTADTILSVAIPVHLHITTNAVVTDYVPKNFRLPARGAVLASTLITYLGIMKLNMAGPGLTNTIKSLWGK